MPVGCNIEFVRMGQDEFHALDKRVMRHAFDIHNTMGRFLDERIYQDELAQRCRVDGMAVERELHLRIMHRTFSKSYFLDVLIEQGGLYEMKAVEALNSSHENQVINYLLLAGIKHGKLVNMRPSSVESRFVSTSLSAQDRTDFRFDEDGFDVAYEIDNAFRDTLYALLDDWGAFLDINLYREALEHLVDGAGVLPVDIVVSGKVVGRQKVCVLNAQTIWHLSSVRNHLDSYKTHLLRLFNHTQIKRVHWVNMDHRNITLQTFRK